MALMQLRFPSVLPTNYIHDYLPSKRSKLGPISFLPRSQTMPIGLSTMIYREKYWNLESRKAKGRLVLVRANNNKGGNGRLIGNLVVAAGLTYLTVTGQLGWVLDAIVSVSILAVLLPIAGIAAFFYFASQNILQSTCPNCGNDFQIFKSSVSDGPQSCPFCSQRFSVEDDKFVREPPTMFTSDKSSPFAQTFGGKERATNAASATIVDVEAEVKDAEID